MSRERQGPSAVRMSIRGYDGPDGASCTFTGLTGTELKTFDSMLLGVVWVSVANGRVVACPRLERMPDPIRDEVMYPFWRRVGDEGVAVQLPLLPRRDLTYKNCYPAITIKHLCGYYYSDENYRRQAEKLESYGFVCMRSQRDDSGQYHEHWHLGGMVFAEGELKKAIQGVAPEKQVEAACRFLGRNVVFGALDVSTQEMAMGPPD